MASSFNGTFVQHEKSAIQYVRPSANLLYGLVVIITHSYEAL
jgi:hypothetical protein